MSKLACLCGNQISDSRYPSATEGQLVAQQDDEKSPAVANVASFIAALLSGRKQEWVRGFFLKGYPEDLSDESIISDILWRSESEAKMRVAECENCGRLWVQVSAGQNCYRSYSPDVGGYAAILRGSHEGEG
jgi:hypothetical protein